MDTIREEIAKNILFYRKKMKLTQKQLADKLDVKNTAVSNWESGNNSIDIETLFRAAQLFGVDVSAMFGKYASSTGSPPLAVDEARLLDDYRDASEEIREEAAGMLHRSAERNREKGSSMTA